MTMLIFLAIDRSITSIGNYSLKDYVKSMVLVYAFICAGSMAINSVVLIIMHVYLIIISTTWKHGKLPAAEKLSTAQSNWKNSGHTVIQP